MKTSGSFTFVVAIAIQFVFSAKGLAAREYVPPTAPGAPPSESAVSLPEKLEGVVKLSHAKVEENVILAFVEHSKPSFKLTAAEILELRKRGVSDRVVIAMIKQTSGLPAATTAVAVAASPAENTPPPSPVPSAEVATVTLVSSQETVPAAYAVLQVDQPAPLVPPEETIYVAPDAAPA